MQVTRNAYDLFPADQFDAWIDGVRAKIVDGLEHQHAPDDHEVRVPELSAQALEAIQSARREAENNPQAGPSSSYSRADVSESYQLESDGSVANQTMITEVHQTIISKQSGQAPSEQDSDDQDDHYEDDDYDNVEHSDADMENGSENPELHGAYPASPLSATGDYLVSQEGERHGSDAGGELDEEEEEEEEEEDELGQDDDDEIIMLDDSYEEGSDREMTPNGDRDELESDDDAIGLDEPVVGIEHRGATGSPVVQEEPAIASDQWLVDAIESHAAFPASDLPSGDLSRDIPMVASGQDEPAAEGEAERSEILSINADADISDEEQSGSEDAEEEDESERSKPDDDEIISVADSSDEEDHRGSVDQSASPDERSLPMATSRQSASDQEEDEGEEGEDEDMDGRQSDTSNNDQSVVEGDDMEDEESEDELNDNRSRKSAYQRRVNVILTFLRLRSFCRGRQSPTSRSPPRYPPACDASNRGDGWRLPRDRGNRWHSSRRSQNGRGISAGRG